MDKQQQDQDHDRGMVIVSPSGRLWRVADRDSAGRPITPEHVSTLAKTLGFEVTR